MVFALLQRYAVDAVTAHGQEEKSRHVEVHSLLENPRAPDVDVFGARLNQKLPVKPLFKAIP